MATINSLELDNYSKAVDLALSEALTNGLGRDGLLSQRATLIYVASGGSMGAVQYDPRAEVIEVFVHLDDPLETYPKGTTVLDMRVGSPTYRKFMISRADPPDPPRWAPMLSLGEVMDPRSFLAASSVGTPGVADVNIMSTSGTVIVGSKSVNSGGVTFDLSAAADVQATNVQGAGHRVVTLTINGVAKDVLESITTLTKDANTVEVDVQAGYSTTSIQTVNVTFQANSVTLPSGSAMGDRLFVTSDGQSTGTVLEEWSYTGSSWFQVSGTLKVSGAVIDNTIGNSGLVSLPGRYVVPASGTSGAFAGQESKYADFDGSTFLFSSPTANSKVSITSGPNAGQVWTFSAGSWSFSSLTTGLPIFEWSLIREFTQGSLCVYQNNIYRANAAIPANTPFNVGSTGATWTQIGGSTTSSGLLIPVEGSGFGKIFASGPRLWRSGLNGANPTSAFPRIHGSGYDVAFTNSVPLPILSGPPGWTKIQDSSTTFIGLGSDKKFYVAGVGAKVGFSGTSPIVRVHPSALLSGAGVEALNFWATDGKSDLDTNDSLSVYYHVNDNGTLKTYSCGANNFGQLGNGNSSDQNTPVLVPALTGKSIVSCHSVNSTTVVVTSTGELWGSGYNDNGQLGLGNNTASTSFVQAKTSVSTNLTNVAEARISWEEGIGVSVFALRTDGTVFATGDNAGGKLGNGNTTARNYFTQVLTAAGTPLTGITRLRTFCVGAAMLKNDGGLFYTGRNINGVWGNGSAANTASNNYAVQRQTGVSTFWSTITPRGCPAVFVVKNNVLYASGHSADYQLGDGSFDTQVLTASPVPIPDGDYPVALKQIGSVTSANDPVLGVLIVTAKGRLCAWGDEGVITQRTPFARPIIDFY